MYNPVVTNTAIIVADTWNNFVVFFSNYAEQSLSLRLASTKTLINWLRSFRDRLESNSNGFEWFLLHVVFSLEDIVIHAALCNSDAPLITERPEWKTTWSTNMRPFGYKNLQPSTLTFTHRTNVARRLD